MRALVPERGLAAFRKEMDRFMERFWDGDEMAAFIGWTPDVDIFETKEALTVKAELPGLDLKDLQLTLEAGLLTLRGEKRQDVEQKNERLYRSERHYGQFTRTIRLPATVDPAKVTAGFKNGVLTIVMPKTAEAMGKMIPITAG